MQGSLCRPGSTRAGCNAASISVGPKAGTAVSEGSPVCEAEVTSAGLLCPHLGGSVCASAHREPASRITPSHPISCDPIESCHVEQDCPETGTFFLLGLNSSFCIASQPGGANSVGLSTGNASTRRWMCMEGICSCSAWVQAGGYEPGCFLLQNPQILRQQEASWGKLNHWHLKWAEIRMETGC